jgi:hypothetical protein
VRRKAMAVGNMMGPQAAAGGAGGGGGGGVHQQRDAQTAVYSEDVVRVLNPQDDDPTTLGLVSRVYGDSDDEMHDDEDSDTDVSHNPLSLRVWVGGRMSGCGACCGSAPSRCRQASQRR